MLSSNGRQEAGDAGVGTVLQRRPIKVLHCPTDVGGNPAGLSFGEQLAGLDSTTVTFGGNYIGYKSDRQLFAPHDSLLVQEWKRWRFVREVASSFDVVHFNFGSTILRQRTHVGHERFFRRAARQALNVYAWAFEYTDLRILRSLGKAIFVTYQGSDARQGDFCRTKFDICYEDPVTFTAAGDRLRRRNICAFDRYADGIYAVNPDLLHVLPRRALFMPYAHIDLAAWTPAWRPPTARPVLLHAPTHRTIKGTEHVLNAVESLRTEGVDFEFVMVENLSHAEARRQYERADLLVDQVLVGWYGGLAVELMALGKPVMAYLREDDLKFIPEQMKNDLPIINVTPSGLVASLRQWLTAGREVLLERGRLSRKFVERWHDPVKIGRQLSRHYVDALCKRTKSS